MVRHASTLVSVSQDFTPFTRSCTDARMKLPITFQLAMLELEICREWPEIPAPDRGSGRSSCSLVSEPGTRIARGYGPPEMVFPAAWADAVWKHGHAGAPAIRRPEHTRLDPTTP